MDVEWTRWLWKLNQALGGVRRSYGAIVFINDLFIGSTDEFQSYLESHYNFIFNLYFINYCKCIYQDIEHYYNKDKVTFLKMVFLSKNKTIGYIIFVLLNELVPKTCNYFKNLCMDITNGYFNSPVHRISVDNGFIQAGRLVNRGEFLKKENYHVRHDRRGVLSLAGRQTSYNGPEFVISLRSNPWMDGKYVAFGYAVEGEKTLRALETSLAVREVPIDPIRIGHCNLLVNRDSQEDTWPDVNLFVHRLIDELLQKAMYIQVYGRPERYSIELTDSEYAETLTRILMCKLLRIIDQLPSIGFDVETSASSKTHLTSVPSVRSDWEEHIIKTVDLDQREPHRYRPFVHV
ncbi:probable inactive peptidyl-prolyl cis-trans isomerase-like 6 [Daktulosphaira vitifoliae]|uniref:probable inactive peptidyl-prolyl cis-trans isomerase-like 6 n=1 Tax=Daktulosphaira vitifoliae TaxID=58002 RepID=UPI0021AA83B0|nr:probable inactive peptidyl-prolyl cis-trans isomerase-like 6 [Daktulosphaira vitifoliae]